MQAAKHGPNFWCFCMRHPSPFSVPLHLVYIRCLHRHSEWPASYFARHASYSPKWLLLHLSFSVLLFTMKMSMNRDWLCCCVKGTCEMACTMTPGSYSFSYKPLCIASPVSHGRRESSIFSCYVPWCPLISSLRRKSVAQCAPADLDIDALFATLRILQANLPVSSQSFLFHTTLLINLDTAVMAILNRSNTTSRLLTSC